MDECRACGQPPDDKNRLSESLRKYYDIYFNLTSIQLTEDEDPNRQRICDHCHLKLLEYNRFRTVCLQVHQKLIEIKKETPDDSEYIPFECETFVETLKVEGTDDLGTEPTEKEPAEKEPETKVKDGSVKSVSDTDDDSDSDYEAPKKTKKITQKTKKPLKIKKIMQKTKKIPKTKKEGSSAVEKVYQCDQCERKFRSEVRFQGHLREHKGLKPALCNQCGKAFAVYKNLRLHIRQKHAATEADRPKFPCDFPGCDLIYATRQGMRLHRKRHEPNFEPPVRKRSVCEQCGKTFSTVGALKKHYYTHTGDLPFQCTICNKKLLTVHKLKEHTMRHEGIKNYVCPHCGLRKTTRHELKIHMNYHTREKQYTCHVCSQVFTNIGNMTRHIKIKHCGIKAYACTYCDRCFGKAETLKHHVMTHTGEKPNVCKECGKRFIQPTALQTHMKTHRKHLQQPKASMQHVQLQSAQLDAAVACVRSMILPQQHLEQSPATSSDVLEDFSN